MTEQIRQAFAATYRLTPEVLAYAPGRFGFIGRIDDNGGPMLGAAFDLGVWVALVARSAGRRRMAGD